MPDGAGFPFFARAGRMARCCLASAPRRNFSSRFLWRSSLSAAFASSRRCHRDRHRRAVDLGETHGNELHG